ncbi:MAG: hypothetical protein ACO1O6_10280 [Bacteroidota bacterium]
MKKVLFILLMILNSSAFCQLNWLHINGNYMLDLWKPYSKESQAYMKEGKKVYSNAWNMNLMATILRRPKFAWSTGISYKKINFTVEDRITNWAFTKGFDNNQIIDTFYYTFQDPANLKAVSQSYGFINQFSYTILDKENFKNYLGINVSVYALEYYDSWYESDQIQSDDEPTDYAKLQSDEKPYPNPGPLKNWFLSSISTEIFYNIFYLPIGYKGNFSIGAKISLGTNVYSDWDQFRKYAWMGVGLEIGFGKRRINDSLKD